MKIIIPMAGKGTRLRPHTLTTPKPLIPIAGKSIVERLIEGIMGIVKDRVEEIVFVIHPDFGEDVISRLKGISEKFGCRGIVCYQKEALGTGHAILCAEQYLKGRLIVAYADTLFGGDFDIDPKADSIVWVKKVENPADFGVVKLDSDGCIVKFIEKPRDNISDLAIIGVYYFKQGEVLKKHLRYLIDYDIRKGKEYQLTDALERMRVQNLKFYTGEVDVWMDCSNKIATVKTNIDVLRFMGKNVVSEDLKSENSNIIPPCFIDEGVVLKDTTVGPYTSIGKHTQVEKSTLSHCLVQSSSFISNATLSHAMIGNFAHFDGNFTSVSLGDYSELTP